MTLNWSLKGLRPINSLQLLGHHRFMAPVIMDLVPGALSGYGNGGDAPYQEFQQAWPRRFCREI